MTYAVSKISAQSPDMSDAEFAEFVADIQKNGQLVPIWVRGAEIIDGRKRFAACIQLGIKPKVVNLDPQQDTDDIARALNVLRTHYSSSQRALYAASRVSRPSSGSQKSESTSRLPTAEQVASEAGVSRDYVFKARQVVRDGTPEVVDAVKKGSLTVRGALAIVEQVPKGEQPNVVARVVEASKDKPKQSPTAKILNNGEDVRRHRAQPAKPDEQFRRSISMLEVAVDVLMTNAPMVKRDFKRAEWLESLSDSRTTITHIIKALEN